MNSEDVTYRVANLVGSILGCDPAESISRDTEPDWDSLNHVEIIFSVEEEFSVRLPREALVTLDSVQKIASAIVSNMTAP